MLFPTLYCSAAYGKKTTLENWEKGLDFYGLGEQYFGYFSIRNIEQLKQDWARIVFIDKTTGKFPFTLEF